MPTFPLRRRRPAPAGTAIVALAAVLTAGTGRPARAQSEPRDRHVYVTVLDRADRPVTDLKLSEVSVKEDGKAREIVSVRPAASPQQIALLVDDTQAAQAATVEIRQGLTSFVQAVAAANRDTEMALWTFGERPTKQIDFTTSAAALTRMANTYFPRNGAGSYFMEAVLDVCDEFKSRGATRPILVAFLFEDGPEFSSAPESADIEALKSAGASLWTIVVQGHTDPTGVQVEKRDRMTLIDDDARASGGSSKMILDRLALDAAYRHVADFVTSQVDITYARPDRTIPPSRMEVKVSRPGLTVLSPQWAGR